MLTTVSTATGLRSARLILCALLFVAGCRTEARNATEPAEPIDAQHTVSSSTIYNNLLLIDTRCNHTSFMAASQELLVSRAPTPGVVFVLDPASPQAYDLPNARHLVDLLRRQVSASLEANPQQACLDQFADYLENLADVAERKKR